MSDAIIVAIIALFSTVISSLITAKIAKDKITEELKTKTEIQNVKIEYISQEVKKLENLNNLDAKLNVLEEKIKVANNRITDLEKLNE